MEFQPNKFVPDNGILDTSSSLFRFIWYNYIHFSRFEEQKIN